MPEATIKAFKDHGQTKITIGDLLEDAEKLSQVLTTVGLELDQVTEQLESEGVRLFSDSFFSLSKEIAAKRDSFLFKAQAEQRRYP